MINRQILKRVVLFAVAAALLFPACSVVFRMRPRALNRSDIVQRTGLKLPASAEILESKSIQMMQDKRLYAKIKIDAKDADALVASLSDDEMTVSRKQVFVSRTEAGISWWDPGTPKKYVSFDGRLPNGAGRMAGMIDLDGQDGAVVYLHVIW